MVPKGTLIEECGKMLAKGPPKRDKHGNVVKDKSGKVVHMTDYETIMVFLGILALLISFGGLLIALLTFLDKRNKRK